MLPPTINTAPTSDNALPKPAITAVNKEYLPSHNIVVERLWLLGTLLNKSLEYMSKIDINYVKENPSIIGKTINLTEPNIENIKNNLNYLRAEADSLALEFRLHSKEIHENFINNDEHSNEIINALEQSRIEVKGGQEFQGIKKNLTDKHIQDLKNKSLSNETEKLTDAFRYTAYQELMGEDLGNQNNKNKKLIKEKFGKNYNNFFRHFFIGLTAV